MIIRVGMAPRAAGTSYEAFAEHWRTQHAAIARKLPGLRSYVQNHAVLANGRPVLAYPGFDACSQFEFDDMAAMDASFASVPPDGELRRDELTFIDPTRRMGMFAEASVIHAGEAPDAAVKLMTFLRVAPGAGLPELLAALDAAAQQTGDAGGSILRRERLSVLAGAHTGRLPAWCDAIDVVTVSDAETALRLLSTKAADDSAWALAGVGQVCGRLVATEVWVVRPLQADAPSSE